MLPLHTAVIMDGNGRWAKEKNVPRSKGHKSGVKSLENLMDSALSLRLKYISLYAFSTENWKRPEREIKFIFSLLVHYIDRNLTKIHHKGIKILHSGSRRRLEPEILEKIDEAVKKTQHNKNLVLNFCLDYGSQEEILEAFQQLITVRVKEKKKIDLKITKKEFEKYLYTNSLPPVDLMIRTSGEQRISNYLLWQSAYAELYFTKNYWPDFDESELIKALDWYKNRNRRFGGI